MPGKACSKLMCTACLFHYSLCKVKNKSQTPIPPRDIEDLILLKSDWLTTFLTMNSELIFQDKPF